MLDRGAIEKIAELAQPGHVEIEGRQYTTGKLALVNNPTPVPLSLATLQGLVDYLVSDFDGHEKEAGMTSVLVGSSRHVSAVGGLDSTTLQRSVLAQSTAQECGFKFSTYYSQENFIVGLQTNFVHTPDVAGLLKVVSCITADEIQTSADDGVSQVATAKAGITLKDRVTLPSPIVLQPYRTFREVDQPPSPFILRARRSESGAVVLALFEADGGTWEIEATKRVSEWLRQRLGPAWLVLA